MIKVYLTGLLLLAVTYLSQAYARSHAGDEMLFTFGLYLMMISWSVVAESVLFATLFRARIRERKILKVALSILANSLRDPVVIASVGIVVLIYLYYQAQDFLHTDGPMVLLVAICFFLRIAESSAKSYASRAGNHRQQQLVINLFASAKWIAVAIAVVFESESAIYAGISVLSFLSILVLAQYSEELSGEVNAAPKDPDEPVQRCIMLMATIVGVISFQLDKFLAMKFFDNGAAGTYVLSYSLVFLLIQALNPVYNKYISDLWVWGDGGENRDTQHARFSQVILLISYIGAVLNLVVIAIVPYYFERSFGGYREYIDVVALTLAVFLCAINHIYYFNYVESRQYYKIFYQNLMGLVFGLCAAAVAIVHEFRYGVSFVPFFVTLGQYLYVVRDACKGGGKKKCRRALAIFMRPVLPAICIIVVGLFAIYCHALKAFPMWMIFVSLVVLWASILIIRRDNQDTLINSFRVELINSRGER